MNCEHCGGPLTRAKKGRPRRYCDGACRRAAVTMRYTDAIADAADTIGALTNRVTVLESERDALRDRLSDRPPSAL